MEHNCNEQWSPLTSTTCTERNPNHDTVKNDSSLQDRHIKVRLRARKIGVRVWCRTMRVTERFSMLSNGGRCRRIGRIGMGQRILHRSLALP